MHPIINLSSATHMEWTKHALFMPWPKALAPEIWMTPTNASLNQGSQAQENTWHDPIYTVLKVGQTPVYEARTIAPLGVVGERRCKVEGW